MVCNQNNYLNLKLEGSCILRLHCKKWKFWFSMINKYPCLKRLMYVLNLSQCEELACSDLAKALCCMRKYRWCQIVWGKRRGRVLPPRAWAGTLGKPVEGKVQGLRAGNNVCQRSAAQGVSALPRKWELSRGAVQPWCLHIVLFHAARQPLDCSLSPGWWNEKKAGWFGFCFFPFLY